MDSGIASRLLPIERALAVGNIALAGGLVDAMLARYPQDQALRNATLSLILGWDRWQDAALVMDKSLRLRSSAEAWLELGRMLLSRQRPVDAESALRRATSLRTNSASIWYLLGVALYQSRKDVEASHAMLEALRHAPDNPEVLRGLAEIEFGLERYAAALPRFELLQRLGDPDLAVVERIARCHSRLGNPAAGHEVCMRALRENPGAARLALLEAQLQEDLGDADTARNAYERAMGLQPDWMEPVGGLLMLLRRDAPAELVDRAETALAERSDIPLLDRAYLHYALGGVKDTEGEYGAAFKHWSVANGLRRQHGGGADVEALDSLVVNTIRTYSTLGETAKHTPPPAEPCPVFVVGMPRSGTTLVEQVIAAHPLGHGAGELTELSRLAESLRAQNANDISVLGKDWLSEMARDYMAVCARGAHAGALRVVDKQPYNFFHLGLAFQMFPDAKVIWCQRDPRDIAISIFGESFSPQAAYATDLDEIYGVYRAHVRLMEHWIRLRPKSVIEVDYEILVTDFESSARRLIDFIGLPWSEHCLNFHLSRRHVQTNSRWQVRQPVHSRAVGRWKNYREFVPGGNLGWAD